MHNEALDGLLLGDGSLWLPPIVGVRRTSNAYYRQSSVSKDWLEGLVPTLGRMGLRSSVRFVRSHRCKDGRESAIWWLQSQAHYSMTEAARRWYPSRKKVIPTDLTLSRECLLQWFLGDGTMVPSNKKRRVAVLCSEGFAKGSVEALVPAIRGLIGCDGVSTYNRRAGYNVRFTYDATDALLAFLGPAPFKSLAYKWDTRLVRGEATS